MEKSPTFFIMMLATFLARVNPPSTMAKPACMRNTSIPAMTVHKVSTVTCNSGTGFPSTMPSSAYAMAGTSTSASPMAAKIRSRLSISRPYASSPQRNADDDAAHDIARLEVRPRTVLVGVVTRHAGG